MCHSWDLSENRSEQSRTPEADPNSQSCVRHVTLFRCFNFQLLFRCSESKTCRTLDNQRTGVSMIHGPQQATFKEQQTHETHHDKLGLTKRSINPCLTATDDISPQSESQSLCPQVPKVSFIQRVTAIDFHTQVPCSD